MLYTVLADEHFSFPCVKPDGINLVSCCCALALLGLGALVPLLLDCFRSSCTRAFGDLDTGILE